MEEIKTVLHWLTIEEWTALYTIITAFLVFGVLSVIQISKAHKLNSAILLYDQLEKTKKDRYFVLGEFEFNNESVIDDAETISRVKNVINAWNQIGLLIENKVISQKLLFPLCYPIIIQTWYKIEDYALYQTEILGVNYANRVKRLAQMAKNYHDSIPEYRSKEIKIKTDMEYVVVHKTNMPGETINQIVWKFNMLLRRLFKNYLWSWERKRISKDYIKR